MLEDLATSRMHSVDVSMEQRGLSCSIQLEERLDISGRTSARQADRLGQGKTTITRVNFKNSDLFAASRQIRRQIEETTSTTTRKS